MMRKIRGRAAGPRPAAAARDPRFLAEAATAAPVRFHIATHAAGAMDFFEGKRGSEVSITFRRFWPFIGTMLDMIEYAPGPIVALVSLRGGSKRLLTPAPRLATPLA